MSALFAVANCGDADCNHESWCAAQSMSGFDASLPMQEAIVSRQVRTV